MFDLQDISRALTDNWPIWFVTITLVVAAVIDGLKLKVPNWITFPMIISGWIYSATLSPYAGWEGLMYSLIGTVVGLALLLPLYAIGGMGAGDVKLLAGVGAWVWGTTTLYAFAVSAIVGGIIAVLMVVLATQAGSSTNPVLDDLQRNPDRERSRKAGRDRRRAKAVA